MKNPTLTVGNIIDKQSTCFISTVDNDGFPNIKAMLQPRLREGIKKIYLTTNTSSLKVQSILKNNKVCLYFVDKRFYRGVCLIGNANILETLEAKTMIWHEGDEMYYSLGVNDPDYCVIEFIASKGRYYSNFKSEDFKVE